MVKIEFLGPIGKAPIELDISSLHELSIYMANDKELKEWVKNSAIAVNDTLIQDPNHKLKSGDIVSILPPVCGG